MKLPISVDIRAVIYSDYILKPSYYKFSAFNAYIYGTDIINQRNL